MSAYKKRLFRALDDNALRLLNQQNENLDTLLNLGLNFSENFDCKIITYTSNAIANTQDTVAHTLGKTPIGAIPIRQDKAGSLYFSATENATNLYLKCSVASVAFKLLIF